MLHVYEHPAAMAMEDDFLTGTKQGDCLPTCIQVDSCHYPRRALLRVPVSDYLRAGCKDVWELYRLIEQVIHTEKKEHE